MTTQRIQNVSQKINSSVAIAPLSLWQNKLQQLSPPPFFFTLMIKVDPVKKMRKGLVPKNFEKS